MHGSDGKHWKSSTASLAHRHTACNLLGINCSIKPVVTRQPLIANATTLLLVHFYFALI